VLCYTRNVPPIVRLFAAHVLLATASCPAIVVDEDFTLARAATLASNFPSAGSVLIQEGASSYRGSGVLVAPDWVLTAGHNWLADEVTDLSFIIGGQTIAAQSGQWFHHPLWDADPTLSPSNGWDIALFQLSSPVTGVAPASWYTGTNELGSQITLVGSGLAGTGATGPQPNASATLYAANNTIDRVLDTDLGGIASGLLALDFDSGDIARNSLDGTSVYDTGGDPLNSIPNGTIFSLSSATNVLVLEGTSAGGDSGGPAFADFGHGFELVGIVSWGVNPTDPSRPYGSGYGDVTYLTRVSAFDDWIRATIPEPSLSYAVALMALALVFARRPKHD